VRISNAMQAGFISEMEKLSQTAGVASPGSGLVALLKDLDIVKPPEPKATGKAKKAGILTNLGTRIVSSAKAAPGWIGKQMAETGENVGKTLYKGLAHPMKGVRQGLDFEMRSAANGGIANKVGLGLSAYGAYSGAKELKKTKEEAGGVGRGERLGKFIGNVGGGLIGAPHGVTGSLAGTMGAEYLLGRAGRGADTVLDKIRGKKQKVPMQSQVPPGQVQPG